MKRKRFDLKKNLIQVDVQPILPVLSSDNLKIVDSTEWQFANDEKRNSNFIRTLELLKQNNNWSYSQLRVCQPIERQNTPWDCVLEEMVT